MTLGFSREMHHNGRIRRGQLYGRRTVGKLRIGQFPPGQIGRSLNVKAEDGVCASLLGVAVAGEPAFEGFGVVGVGDGEFAAYVRHAFLLIVLDDGGGEDEIVLLVFVFVLGEFGVLEGW